MESLMQIVDNMANKTEKSSFATRFGEIIGIDHPDLKKGLIESAKKNKGINKKPEIELLNLTNYLQTNSAPTRSQDVTLSSRSRRYTKSQVECHLTSFLEVC